MDDETRKKARHLMKGFCRVCPVCDGKSCAGEVPGMGGTGSGSSFFENIRALERIKLEMRVIHPHADPDTSTRFLDIPLRLPILGAPVGGVRFNMSSQIEEKPYVEALIRGANRAGTLAGTGDGELPEIFDSAMEVLKPRECPGIPFIKPWEEAVLQERIEEIQSWGCKLFGMDLDAAGLITLKTMGRPVYPKTVTELRRMAERCNLKMILKGIMTADQARLAVDAGADAIVVSNHGGRVLDHTPGTADVLPSIVEAAGHDLEVLVDGGIRTGTDVFKMLALGAKAVLIGRPLAIASIGGGEEAVAAEYELLRSQLKEVMVMTGSLDTGSISTAQLHGFA